MDGSALLDANQETKKTVAPEDEITSKLPTTDTSDEKAFIEEFEPGYETVDLQTRILGGGSRDADQIQAAPEHSTTAYDEAMEELKSNHTTHIPHTADTVPTAAVVTALAAHISDAESKSEAVEELKEAAPIVVDAKDVAATESKDDHDLHAKSTQIVPTTAAVTALAAHISDAGSKSEAVEEMKETAPILDSTSQIDKAILADIRGEEPTSIGIVPKDLIESTHAPSTTLPVDRSAISDPVVGTIPETTSAEKHEEVPSSALAAPGHNRSFSEAAGMTLNSSNLAPAPASAFENRPDLSRRTSAASSILPFRRREGSSTPSSRSSRPLSGVFDRLRGWSRSRNERSRSRPASLVLSRSNLLSDEGLSTPAPDEQSKAVTRGLTLDEADEHDKLVTPKAPQHTFTSDFALTDFSDVAVDSMKATSPKSPPAALNSPQRTETWNDPDAQIPPKTPDPRHHSENHGRLGVLPSPAPTATTFADGENAQRHASLEQARRRSSAVAYGAWRQGLEDQYGGGEKLEPVKSRVNSEEDVGVDANAAVAHVASTNSSSPTKGSPTRRPQQQRKVSDITTLPSQQRRASESASKPPSLSSGSPRKATISRSQTGTIAPGGNGSGMLFPSHSRNISQVSGFTTGGNESGMLVTGHSRNISQVSGLTDAELAEASPLTIRAAEPTLLQHDATSEDQSKWDQVIAEQEAEIQRLEGVRMPRQAEAQKSVEAAPPQTRAAGGAFASIIASATARNERQRPVESQPNPYVLSDTSATSSGAHDLEVPRRPSSAEKWEDARSEVSAEEGAQEDSFHQSTDPSESRRSSVSSIGANAALTGLRTSSGHHSAELVAAAAAATAAISQPSSPRPQPPRSPAEQQPASFETVRGPAEHGAQPLMTEPMSSQAVPAGPIGASPTTATQSRPQLAHTRTTSQGLLPGMRPPSLGNSDFQKRFSQRLYAQRPDMGERPLSYMPLPRDEGGFVREEIDTSAGATSARQNGAETSPTAATPVEQAGTATPPGADISALSGPPAGTAPFQQHPVFRNSMVDVQPTEYEKMRSSSRQGGVLTSPGLTDGPGSPNSQPGYFRDAQPLTSAIPGRDVISDNHGLEDVHDWGQTVTTPHDEAPGGTPSEQQKHGRKKSGMWNAFTNRRAPNGAKPDIVAPIAPLASLENSESVNANITAGEPERMDTIRKGQKTLQKPQRANTNAVKLSESEPKKKRFSGLKSLLGRSTTTAGEGSARASSQTREAKTRKLSKVAPAAPTPPPQYQPGNPATVKGEMTSYEEYERARKREMAAYAEQSSHVQRSHTRAQSSQVPTSPVDQDRTPTGQPPIDGWYGPSSQRHSEDAVRGAQVQQMPDYRRLHSQGSTHERPLARVPEAFRPVDASFKKPVEPIGPPPGHTPPMREFGPSAQAAPQPQYAPGRQERWGSDGTVPISGRSEYYATGQRPFGSVPTISPVQHRLPQLQTQSPEPRDRVVSMGTELARSPAKDYQDQQTPFAITLPAGSQPSSREASWGESHLPVEAQQQYQPPPQQYQYAETSPPRMRSSEYQQQYQQQNQAYMRNDSRYGPGSPPPQNYSYGRSDIPGQAYSHDRGAYPSPPYSPEQHQSPYQRPPPQQQAQYDWMSRQALTQGQNYSHPAQAPMYQSRMEAGAQAGWAPREQRPVEHRRYYSQGAQPKPQHVASVQQRQFMRGEEGGVNHRQRRPSTGYSGRRDDPAVGEEEVEMIMRGASYPGQEWDPYSRRP